MKLRSLFAGLGACLLLTMSAMTSATIITIDNTDAGFSSSGFTSSTFTGVGSFFGADYVFDRIGSYGDFATWDPTGSLDWVAGAWQIEMMWSALSSRSDNVFVTVDLGSASTTLFVNQKVNGGVWNDIGIFTFASTGASITIDDSSSLRNQYITADAVRFTLISPSQAAQAATVSAPSAFILVLLSVGALLTTRKKIMP